MARVASVDSLLIRKPCRSAEKAACAAIAAVTSVSALATREKLVQYDDEDVAAF